MKPEAAEHLDRAGEYLTKARNPLDVLHYNDEAGRAAYLAAMHSARALIFERTGQVAWRGQQPVQSADPRRSAR